MYRRADWKLIIQSDNKQSKFEPIALYNLEDNPQENKDRNMVNDPEHKTLVDKMLKEYLEILNPRQRTAPMS